MDETTISKIKSQIEEIEKRIKSLSLQFTTTAQMNAVKICLSEIKDLLISLGTEMDNHIKDCDIHKTEYRDLLNKYNEMNTLLTTHLQTYSTDKNSNNKIHGDLNASILEINNVLGGLESKYSSLKTRVLALEEAQGGGSGTSPIFSQIETTHWIDTYQIIPCLKDNPTYNSHKIYFYCEPTQTVEIQIKMTFEVITSSMNPYARIYVNDDYFRQGVVKPFEVGDHVFVFDEIHYIPTQKVNFMQIESEFAKKYNVKQVDIKINARNIYFINKEKDLNITCFNNHYYIAYKTPRAYLMYGIQQKDNLAINEGALKVLLKDKMNTLYNRVNMAPILKKSKVVEFEKDMQSSFCFICQNGELEQNPCAVLIDKDGVLTREIYWGFSTSNVDFVPGGMGNGSEVILFSTTKGVGDILGRGSKGTTIYLNGQGLKDEWFSVSAVKDNNVKIGDNDVPYKGAIFWRKDNMNVFFPNIENDYFVEIAPGVDTTAYYQLDGTINVYINRLGNVYKYILSKGIDGKYKVSNDIDIYRGITRFEELYDGKALVFMNEKYRLIQNINELIIEHM